jgi:hypothetical protein
VCVRVCVCVYVCVSVCVCACVRVCVCAASLPLVALAREVPRGFRMFSKFCTVLGKFRVSGLDFMVSGAEGLRI